MATATRTPFAVLNEEPVARSSINKRASSKEAEDDAAPLKTLLKGVLSLSATQRTAAAEALKEQSVLPGFCANLLSIISGPCNPKALPTKLSAATYLKNFLKAKWSERVVLREEQAEGKEEAKEKKVTMIPCAEERVGVRNALLRALLSASVSELRNMLAECFRMVVAEDFPAEWPGLVDVLEAELKRHGGRRDKENDPWALENVCIAIHVLSKRYKYFSNSAGPKNTVPAELTDIMQRLVTREYRLIFEPMALVMASSGGKEAENEEGTVVSVKLLRIVLKTFFCATRSFMGDTFKVAPWLATTVKLLDSAVGDAEMAAASGKVAEDEEDMEEDAGDNAAWRLHKRAVQLLLNFQARHRTLKAFKQVEPAVLRLAQRAVKIQGKAFFSDRVRALFFDALSTGLETTAGWKALQPELPALLRDAVLPALAFSDHDKELWLDDEDDFIRTHVEDVVASNNAFGEDCITTRLSAVNFVGVLAACEARHSVPKTKRKKKTRSRKSKRAAPAAAGGHLKAFLEDLIATVTDDAPKQQGSPKRRRSEGGAKELSAESVHYALLMALGAAARNMGFNAPAIASIIKNVLLPACHENYSSDSLVPALQAASLWVLSRITEHIPSNLTMKCFSRSVELMSAADREKDDEEVSWKPVRFTASSCLRELIDQKFSREMLRPHLGDLVSRLAAAAAGVDTACLSLLSLAVSKAEDDIIPHAGKLGAALVGRCVEEIESGVDITETPTLESLVNITNALMGAVEENDGEDSDGDGEEEKGADVDPVAVREAAALVAGHLPELLGKYWRKGDDEVTFMPDTVFLLSFMLTASSPSEADTESAGVPIALWPTVNTFLQRLPEWWSELSESDECWDVLMRLAKCTSGHDEQRVVCFRGLCGLASNWIQHACQFSHFGAYRFFMAVFSTGIDNSTWLDTATAASVAEAVTAVFSAGFDKDDEFQRAASVLACFAIGVEEARGTMFAAWEDSGVVSDVLKGVAHASVACVEEEDVAGVYQHLVFGGMAIGDASMAGVDALDSSSARRLVSEVLDAAAKHAIQLEAALQAEAEAESSDEEEEDEEEEEESDSEADSGDDSDADEGESESEEKGVETEDEDGDEDDEEDAEFYARYGDGEDEEEEEEVVDCSTGFEELVDESNELNAPQAFFEWFAAVGSKGVCFKRATTSLLKRHMAQRK